MSEPDNSLTDLERAKLELEKQKLALERAKLDVERYKARWSAAAVGVPLIALVATAATGVWTQYHQSQLSFSLKAAEIVMGTDNPTVTKNKGRALATLFPEHLPADFGKSFDDNAFGTVETDTKREFVNLLTSKPESARQIVRIWKAAYPDDDWLPPLEAAVEPIKQAHRSAK